MTTMETNNETGILIAGLWLSLFARLAGSCAAQVGPNDTVLSPAKTIAIVGGKLLTVTHGTIENGVVVMSGGQDCGGWPCDFDQGARRCAGL